MCRLNLLGLQSKIAVLSVLLLFARCQTVPEDTVLPVPMLFKGPLNGDPVVQSTPDKIELIAVNNQFDNLFAKEFAKSACPTSEIKEYNKFKAIESIQQSALLKHEFRWVTTRRKNIMVAIFKNIVRVDSKANEISNKSDLVWMWTPPVGTIDPGRVTYAEGKSVSLNQDNQFTFTSPTELYGSTFYIWCILAWDDQGIRIVKASRELPIVLI